MTIKNFARKTTNSRRELVETIMRNSQDMGDGVKSAMIQTSLLNPNPVYQRDDGKKITGKYNPFKAGFIEVSYDEVNSLFNIIDGRHRYLKACEDGIESMKCIIHTGLTEQEEAALFASQMEGIMQLKPYDLYKAWLIAGKDYEDGRAALTLQRVCKEHSIRIIRNPQTNACGVLKALKTALGIVRVNPKKLEWIFDTISMTGWESAPNVYSEKYIKALSNIYEKYALTPKAQEVLTQFLQKFSPKTFACMSVSSYPDVGPSLAITAQMDKIINGCVKGEANSNNIINVGD